VSRLAVADEALLTLVTGPGTVQRILQSDLGRALNQLPIMEGDRRLGRVDEFRREAESLGFVFGERVDDCFVAVTPPKGWTLKHRESYHSDFLDGQGRVRGYQFYKGAFYDRDAFGSFRTRYKIDKSHPDNWWELINPTQPERLYKVEEREVDLRAGEEPHEDDRLIGYAQMTVNDYRHVGRMMNKMGDHFYDEDGYSRIAHPRRVLRKVKVYLPEDQQPARIEPQGFEESIDVIDTATGEVVWKGEVYYHPHRGEPAYHPFIMGDGYDEKSGNRVDAEFKGRKAACDWADKHLPRWKDIAAYWDEPLPHIETRQPRLSLREPQRRWGFFIASEDGRREVPIIACVARGRVKAEKKLKRQYDRHFKGSGLVGSVRPTTARVVIHGE